MIIICAASDGENLELAEKISARAENLNLQAEVIDLAAEALPLYCRKAEAKGMPEELAGLKTRFLNAKAMVFCAPEYNGSIPPVLSNAIAWLSVSGKDFREIFNSKPIGIATYSGGIGQKVLTAMRMQFSHLGANVIGREILTNGKKPLNEESADAILRELERLS